MESQKNCAHPQGSTNGKRHTEEVACSRHASSGREYDWRISCWTGRRRSMLPPTYKPCTEECRASPRRAVRRTPPSGPALSRSHVVSCHGSARRSAASREQGLVPCRAPRFGRHPTNGRPLPDVGYDSRGAGFFTTRRGFEGHRWTKFPSGACSRPPCTHVSSAMSVKLHCKGTGHPSMSATVPRK
jgi:hypothetical protein